jgi:hypothetical protein
MGKIVVTCLGQYVYIKRKKTYSHEKELKTNKRNQHKRNNIDRQNEKGKNKQKKPAQKEQY